MAPQFTTVDEYLASFPDEVRGILEQIRTRIHAVVDAHLEQEIAPYRAAKGTLRFPLRRPIPYDLIERLATVAAAAR